MAEKDVKVNGIQSGDHECWCFLVTKEDFIRIKGVEPNRWDVGPFAEEGSEYRYKLYPSDLIVERKDRQGVVSLSIRSVLHEKAPN